MITIRSIAKEAGVSKSTVSRYLNDGKVSTETSETIKKIIEKYNYTPNDFARNLKISKSNFIGIIIPRYDSPATIAILEGIEKFKSGKEYQKLIVNAQQNTEKEIEALYSLKMNKVAGIIIIATEITKEHIKAIKEIDIPVIIVGQTHKDFFCIGHNEYDAGYKLTQSLIENTNKKITYIGVSEKDVAVGIERKKGIFDALRDNNLKLDSYYETSFKNEDAYNLGMKILDDTKNNLIICATDNIAVGIMKAAQESEISIPKMVSIAGFGGYAIGEQIYPTLTTIDYHFAEMGRIAVECLYALISGTKISNLNLIDTTILMRKSVLIEK